MEILRQEIRLLVDKLAASNPPPGSIEHTTLVFLRALDTAAGRTCRPQTLNAISEPFHQFWLENIPWCAQLSKDVERILILQEELVFDA